MSRPPLPDDFQPPRTRWGAIVWGAFFAAIAMTGLWTITGADRRDAALTWVVTIEPSQLIAVGLLVAGGVVLVAGIAGLLRRVQRRSSERRRHV